MMRMWRVANCSFGPLLGVAAGLVLSVAIGIGGVAAQINADDFIERAEQKADQGDLRGAVEDFTQALRIDPSSVEAYLGRGFAQAELQAFNAAIDDFTQALRLGPADA